MAVFMFILNVRAVQVVLEETLGTAIAACVRGFVTQCGVPVETRGALVLGAGFGIEVDWKCTAILHVAAMLAGILAFPGTATERMRGALYGCCAISLLNLVRIVTVFSTGLYFPDLVSIVHDVVWELIMAASTIAIWIVWVRWVRNRTTGRTDPGHMIRE